MEVCVEVWGWKGLRLGWKKGVGSPAATRLTVYRGADGVWGWGVGEGVRGVGRLTK